MVISGTAAAVLALSATAALAESLKVAVIEPLSGVQTSTGRLVVNGAQFAIDEINAAGGFNGEKIQLREYDNAGTTMGAADKFKQAVADGAQIIVQGTSSAIAGQITEDVRKHNLRNPKRPVLYLNVNSEAMELTGDKCHFFHFRFTTTAPMRVNAMVDAMKAAGQLGTKVYSLNQNYSWGRDVEAAVEGAASRGGYQVVGKVLHDLNKIQDFSPYAAKIKEANPDTVITGNWGNDLLLLMKASAESGSKVRFGTTFLDQVGNIGTAGETAVGHYVANTYNLENDKSSFPEDFKKKFGHYPVFSEPLTVYALRTFNEALKPLSKKGGPVDVTAIAKSLENVKGQFPTGEVTMRKEDHQLIVPVVVSIVKEGARYPADNTKYGFVPVRSVPGKDVVYPVQASCKMTQP
jgi:branched-chain amino acid transport system substrate-binding protein